MTVAYASVKGLAYYDMRRGYNGFTLITPTEGTKVYLIDMLGNVIHAWEAGYPAATPAELLPNGNILFAGRVEGGPLTEFEGAGGVLLEIDWDGKKVCEYQDPYLHHGFFRMKDGNTLVVKWVRTPDDIAAKVKVEGTDPSYWLESMKRGGPMWDDAIQEVTPEGKVVWEWVGHEHFDTEVDLTCPICPKTEWSHATNIGELPDGNIMASFMELNTVAVINKKTGDIIWRFGRKILRHQHFVSVLDNGNLLVFDNNHHGYVPRQDSRVLEVNPEEANPSIEHMHVRVGAQSNAIVWSYEEAATGLFTACNLCSAQRLPNESNLVAEGEWGRIFEVTVDGELIWEFVNNLPSYEAAPGRPRPCSVHGAFRYGAEYSGLKKLGIVDETAHEKKQAAPGKERVKVSKEEQKKATEEFIMERLRRLGY